MSIPAKVVLLGANGAIGRTLGPLLGRHGVPYRVIGRSLLALQVRFHEEPLCEHLQIDPEDKDAFAPACEGAATVVYLVGVALWKFKEHLPLIERALGAARKAGVQRFLLVSSNWSYGPPPHGAFSVGERVSEDSARGPETVKGKIRRQQEDLVLAAHVAGSFTTGVLRIADLYGPRIEASHLWSSFQAAKRGTEAQVLGPIDQPHEFVFVPDAATTILRLLNADAAWDRGSGQSWNLGGVGITSIREMAELIFATEGKPARYAIPGRLTMGFVRAMNPYIRELGEFNYLLQQSLILDDARLAALLGGIEKTSYVEGVRFTLSQR